LIDLFVALLTDGQAKLVKELQTICLSGCHNTVLIIVHSNLNYCHNSCQHNVELFMFITVIHYVIDTAVCVYINRNTQWA